MGFFAALPPLIAVGDSIQACPKDALLRMKKLRKLNNNF